MNTTHILDRAIAIAREAHQGQLYKTGEPYFEHCRRVADDVSSAEEKTVAYLHDVVEKTRAWSLERLAAEGFPVAVLRAVKALTRESGESEEDFVRRAIADPLAKAVKIADLSDNLVQALQTGGDYERLARGLAIARAEPDHVAA